MNGILSAAAAVCEELASINLPHCIIGGVALQRWGEPRMTLDVDITVFCGFGNESKTVDQLLQRFSSRNENPQQFAAINRIVLLKTSNGVGIDVALGGLPFEQRTVDRSTNWIIPEHGTIRTCSAEDLIIHKAFAARDQDWIDIKNVLIRLGHRLDRSLIFDELAPLAELKEEPEILTRLIQLFEQYS